MSRVRENLRARSVLPSWESCLPQSTPSELAVHMLCQCQQYWLIPTHTDNIASVNTTQSRIDSLSLPSMCVHTLLFPLNASAHHTISASSLAHARTSRWCCRTIAAPASGSSTNSTISSTKRRSVHRVGRCRSGVSNTKRVVWPHLPNNLIRCRCIRSQSQRRNHSYRLFRGQISVHRCSPSRIVRRRHRVRSNRVHRAVRVRVNVFRVDDWVTSIFVLIRKTNVNSVNVSDLLALLQTPAGQMLCLYTRSLVLRRVCCFSGYVMVMLFMSCADVVIFSNSITWWCYVFCLVICL